MRLVRTSRAQSALSIYYHERAMSEGRNADLVDVLIVGRGGGSTEDLWAFNKEEVARAIRKSAIPVISAVGHETDFTIADFVADLRAATPSAAAEIVAAREDQICGALDHMKRQLLRLLRFKIADRERECKSTPCHMRSMKYVGSCAVPAKVQTATLSNCNCLLVSQSQSRGAAQTRLSQSWRLCSFRPGFLQRKLVSNWHMRIAGLP